MLDQNPPAGVNHEKGETVLLTVSNTTFQMPELTGEQRTDAINELLRRGLTNTTENVETPEEDSTEPPGTVLRTEPAAGERVQKSGQTIQLVLAKEPAIAIARRRKPAGRSRARASLAGFQVTTVGGAERHHRVRTV